MGLTVLALGLGLAMLIGLSLGMLGGGGSIITVPILVYVLGVPPKEAIAMGLAVVGVTSLVGGLTHGRGGNVNLRVAAAFGAVSMVGTWGGTFLGRFVSGTTQLVVIAAVMLAAAVFMFRNAGRPPGDAVAELPARSRAPLPLVVLSGLAVGGLTGMVGVGGGFLIVPAMVLLLGLTMKEAVGTSLAVIALNALVGFVGHLGQVRIEWSLLSEFTAAAVLGLMVGTWGSRFVSHAQLKQAFSVLLVLMGAFILIKESSS